MQAIDQGLQFFSVEKEAASFVQTPMAKLISTGRVLQKFNTEGTCQECEGPVRKITTHSEVYGEISILPAECEACVGKWINENNRMEAQDKYLKNSTKCCGYQNKMVADQGILVQLSDVQENRSAQYEMTEAVIDLMNGRRRKGFYAHGKPGVGKTFWTKILNNELIKRKKNTCFIRAVDLAITLRKEARQDQYKVVLSEFSKVPVLIVDDYGTQKDTEWVSETMFAIFDARYSANLTTIITSNVPFHQLGRDQSRLVSRIGDNRWMEHIDVSGTDFRINI